MPQPYAWHHSLTMLVLVLVLVIVGMSGSD
jgi:hypothetical protein